MSVSGIVESGRGSDVDAQQVFHARNVLCNKQNLLRTSSLDAISTLVSCSLDIFRSVRRTSLEISRHAKRIFRRNPLLRRTTALNTISAWRAEASGGELEVSRHLPNASDTSLPESKRCGSSFFHIDSSVRSSNFLLNMSSMLRSLRPEKIFALVERGLCPGKIFALVERRWGVCDAAEEHALVERWRGVCETAEEY